MARDSVTSTISTPSTTLTLIKTWTYSFNDATFDTTVVYDLLGSETARPCGISATYTFVSKNPTTAPISVSSLGIISATSIPSPSYPVLITYSVTLQQPVYSVSSQLTEVMLGNCDRMLTLDSAFTYASETVTVVRQL